MNAGWAVTVTESKPWASCTFTGAQVKLELAPPPGMILAELKVEPDGSVSALLVKD